MHTLFFSIKGCGSLNVCSCIISAEQQQQVALNPIFTLQKGFLYFCQPFWNLLVVCVVESLFIYNNLQQRNK